MCDSPVTALDYAPRRRAPRVARLLRMGFWLLLLVGAVASAWKGTRNYAAARLYWQRRDVVQSRFERAIDEANAAIRRGSPDDLRSAWAALNAAQTALRSDPSAFSTAENEHFRAVWSRARLDLHAAGRPALEAERRRLAERRIQEAVEACGQAIAAGDYRRARIYIRGIRRLDRDNEFAAQFGPIVEQAAAEARRPHHPERFLGLYRPEEDGKQRPTPPAQDELPV